MYTHIYEIIIKINPTKLIIIIEKLISFNLIITVLIFLGLIISLIVPLILTIAFFTLMERKIIGAMQLRLGPNFLGLGGILQPLVDGLKLLLKETILPTRSQKSFFLFAPFLLFLLSLTLWLVIPNVNLFVISDLYLVCIFV